MKPYNDTPPSIGLLGGKFRQDNGLSTPLSSLFSSLLHPKAMVVYPSFFPEKCKGELVHISRASSYVSLGLSFLKIILLLRALHPGLTRERHQGPDMKTINLHLQLVAPEYSSRGGCSYFGSDLLLACNS